jgi:hypothetical protein
MARRWRWGAVGESGQSTGINGDQTTVGSTDSGAVYVFHRTAGAWVQEAYVKASNTGSYDEFGGAVALSADGNTMAVAAYHEASSATGIGGDQVNDGATFAGAVYIFRRTGGVWAQEAYVKASNTSSYDEFGWSLGISADGATVAVGARREESGALGINGDEADHSALDAGAVYVFRRGAGGWSQEGLREAIEHGPRLQFRAPARPGRRRRCAGGRRAVREQRRDRDQRRPGQHPCLRWGGLRLPPRRRGLGPGGIREGLEHGRRRLLRRRRRAFRRRRDVGGRRVGRGQQRHRCRRRPRR